MFSEHCRHASGTALVARVLGVRGRGGRWVPGWVVPSRNVLMKRRDFAHKGCLLDRAGPRSCAQAAWSGSACKSR